MTGKPHLAYWDGQWHVCKAHRRTVGWPFESFARACSYAAIIYSSRELLTDFPSPRRWAGVHYRSGPRFRLPPDFPEPPGLTPAEKTIFDVARTSGIVVRES